MQQKHALTTDLGQIHI
uniref:Uncharacterized protein n=1 Tax=Anguilla anguilla TaxID=7936 RepID=A0A0E9UQF2_ANGAN